MILKICLVIIFMFFTFLNNNTQILNFRILSRIFFGSIVIHYKQISNQHRRSVCFNESILIISGARPFATEIVGDVPARNNKFSFLRSPKLSLNRI